MINRNLLGTMILVMLLTSSFLSVGLCAEQANNIIDSRRPSSIIDAIKMRGAWSVAYELYENDAVWHLVLQKIASGEKGWIEVAVALKSGSDAGALETLTLAVGEALEHNPRAVFKFAITSFDLSHVCSGPDIDDARYHSYDLATKAIDLRITKVQSLKDVSLTDLVARCTEHLKSAKNEMAKFYEVEKK